MSKWNDGHVYVDEPTEFQGEVAVIRRTYDTGEVRYQVRVNGHAISSFTVPHPEAVASSNAEAERHVVLCRAWASYAEVLAGAVAQEQTARRQRVLDEVSDGIAVDDLDHMPPVVEKLVDLIIKLEDRK